MRTLTTLAFLLAGTSLFAQSRTEVIAQMTGQGKGKATFKSRGNELEVQAEGENLRRNTTYRLNLGNGKLTANVVTNSLGRFTYRRAWRGTAPQFVAGETAVLRNTANAIVISGTFRNK